jgi:type IV/VI secretion system ImpK/VasF family protein
VNSGRLLEEVNSLWDTVFPWLENAISIVTDSAGNPSAQSLHDRLVAELEALTVQLKKWPSPVPDDTRRQIRDVLAIFLDERVLAQKWISPDRWPLLQESVAGFRDGGSRFYAQLNLLRDAPGTHPFIHQLFLLCIQSGFRGAYGENEGALLALKRSLASRIDLPQTPLSKPVVLGAKELNGREGLSLWSLPPVWLYTLAVAGILLVWVSMWMAPAIHADGSTFHSTTSSTVP